MTASRVDPARPTDAGGAARAADAIAWVGGALVLVAVVVLGFGLYSDLAERLALLSSAGAVALAAAWATRRLLPSAVSDVLAGIAVASLVLGFDVVLHEIGGAISPHVRWILICGALMLLGGALCWWLRSRVAGGLAVAGWVALPAALATSRPEDLDLAIPFLRAVVPETSVWASLALMVLAATAAEQATSFAARRGWVDPSTAMWTGFIATTVLGTALVLAAMLQSQSWFYFILVAGAAAATGFSVWQREWVWLPTAGRLFSTAAVTALGGVDDEPGRAMGLVVLSLSFFTFAPLARRLPDHFAVRVWEGTIWFMGLGVSCAFAFAPGGWPAAGGIWAAAMILLAAFQRRSLALVLGTVALYVTFIVRVIEAFGAGVGAGFGTLLFGVTLLVVVIVWRERAAMWRPHLTLRARASRTDDE